MTDRDNQSTENDVKVEWAVDYQDGAPPRRAGDHLSSSEDEKWRAEQWIQHWNAHREDGMKPALLLRRTVTTTPWTQVIPPGENLMSDQHQAGA